MVFSSATAVSDDGAVVAGVSGPDDPAQRQAFRWTASSAMQSIGTLGGTESSANAISGDGSIIVGTSTDDTGRRLAFRWTLATGIQSLGVPGTGDDGSWFSAEDVSSDGSVIVGTVERPASAEGSAFRWTIDTGMVVLDAPVQTWLEHKRVSVSGDGSTLVTNGGYRWTAAEGTRPLPAGLIPTSVNDDGTVIVGYRKEQSGAVEGGWSPRAVRWTAATGVSDLARPGRDSYASDVTGDGTIVVGQDSFVGPTFLWTTANGRSTFDALVTKGRDPGSFLARDAAFVSRSGRTVVGGGFFNREIGAQQAFVARDEGVVAVETPRPGQYKRGDALAFTVRFSTAVQVSGVPTIDLFVGTARRNAVYVSGSGTSALVFSYVVGRSDTVTKVSLGKKIQYSTRQTAIRDGAGTLQPLDVPGGTVPGVILDATVPKPTGVASPARGTYVPGSPLRFAVTFSEKVFVTGQPRIRLTLDDTSVRAAVYAGGSGTKTIVFQYVVQAGDTARNGPGVARAIDADGGMITDAAGNAAALGIGFPVLQGRRIVPGGTRPASPP